MSRKVYAVPDVSAKLGFSRQWVYELMNKGKLEQATAEDLKSAGINPELISSKRRFITEEALNQYMFGRDIQPIPGEMAL